MHDFYVPGMLHVRVIRPPAIGAKLESVDESSLANLSGVKAVRVNNFLAVVAAEEWTVVRAARAIKAQWSAGSGLPEQSKLAEVLRGLASVFAHSSAQALSGRKVSSSALPCGESA